MDAFDADVLIYAATPGDELGRRVLPLFAPPDAPPDASSTEPIGLGSVMLLPEVLAKPVREGKQEALERLSAMLGRLDLRPVDGATADLAVALSAKHRLKATDAVHLATAVNAGADRFITNNRRDFPTSITEIEICYPADLPDPG